MSTFRIMLEDVTANALIEQMNVDPKQRFVSYKAINKYDDFVAKLLRKQGDTVNNSYWDEHVAIMLDKFCDFFEECEFNGRRGILLKPNRTIAELKEYFRGYLSLKVLNAFMDSKAIKCLIKANSE